ncbi:hypothetical protein U5640_16900 [Streptomyces sp. SS7]|uniref:hypothetical protein n=1 Tax=Streptomyces sp. SS7 TaxID=3108485 RepID=UPI0030EEB4A6
MSWRYDVFACPNETDDHNTCEVWGGAPIDILGGGRWKDAFRKAEALSHGLVTRTYTGKLGWSTKTVTVFERIDGGGVCKGCHKRSQVTGEPLSPESRGPLVKTPFGNEFMCDACQKSSLAAHKRSTRDPDRWLYVPIIDTIDFKAE